jgi:hypothetical protein
LDAPGKRYEIAVLVLGGLGVEVERVGVLDAV